MERKKINYINLYDLDCDDKKNCSYISPEGYPMMFDNNHFTYPWTKIMLSRFDIKIINQRMNDLRRDNDRLY